MIDLGPSGVISRNSAGSQGAFCMCAGVASIAEHKNIPWQRVKNGLHRCAGIRTANHRSVGSLAWHRERLSMSAGIMLVPAG